MDKELLSELRQALVRYGPEGKPYPLFSRLALDYGVSVTVVSRAWDDTVSAAKNPAGTPGMARVKVDWKEASPVADVLPQPGTLAVMPMNAVLIQGRIENQFTLREMAWAVDMKPGEYKALEEGRMLPTEAQAARISALLNIPARNLFVAAADEPVKTTMLNGLNVLQLLRCRRRLTVKELCRVCVPLRTAFVTAIEHGNVKYPLAPVDEMALQKLVEFFQVPKETLLGQIPPEVFQRAAQNTAALHDAVKAAAANLPQLGFVSPQAIADGGKKE